MHAKNLVELAALMSHHAPSLVATQAPIPIRGVEKYWVASRCRLDRWHREFKSAAAIGMDLGRRHAAAESLAGVIEEVFSGEILTRVWACLSAALGHATGQDDAALIARSVMSGHTEARYRALRLLVAGTHLSPPIALELNRLRRKSERWTDLLLGRVAKAGDAGLYAFEPQRVADFAIDTETDGTAWSLVRAGARAAFAAKICERSPNSDVNADVAAAILACLPSGSFLDSGLIQSPALARLRQVVSDRELPRADTGSVGPANRPELRPHSSSPPRRPRWMNG